MGMTVRPSGPHSAGSRLRCTGRCRRRVREAGHDNLSATIQAFAERAGEAKFVRHLRAAGMKHVTRLR
jgi:hypothetical protein